MKKVYELMNASVSAYNLYTIGDVFHNDNGEDYIVLNISKERDKALLAKKLDSKESKIFRSPVVYIGAKGLNIHSWCSGHYFMADFENAVKWFMTNDLADKKPKLITMKELFEHCITYDEGYYIQIVIKKDGYDAVYTIIYESIKDIPKGLMDGLIVEWEVGTQEYEAGCPEFQLPIFTIYMEVRHNPEFKELYESLKNDNEEKVG